ncbi:SARP family transcriptional regulator [Catellatospora sp. TT07R-123]|uniref:AfsR/SARP family transcriptional regulator n=1 Tax=Catellatospora sp. TT07R-123 TaxID=2733863 RepID=UPI001B0AEB9C|nr:AfsR/SARP family transcriptional regulator [Catellatospora sp. TT07R-123]GHJ45388.1 SARP family transcriptional regulator [Catellatospora sp. TT07R-123]
MRYRVLGPVELTADDVAVPLPQPRHRAILGFLVLHAERVVTRDQLIEALWGGAEPSTAASQIHVAVSHLRGALRRHGLSEVIATRPGGYALAAPVQETDAGVFAAELSAAREAQRRGEPREAVRRADRALALWRGEALAGVTAAYAPSARQHLHEQQLAAQELRADAELDLGRHDVLVPVLTGLVEAHPLRERLVTQLMLALYRAGRRADATAVARRMRALLAEGQGLDPGARFVELERAILVGDPALDPPATAPQVRQAAPAAVVPAQLPFDVPSFTGRERELAALGRVGRPGVTVITGQAGAGKTALAAHWAHQVRDSFPDGQLYADLRGFDPSTEPLTPLEVLARFLRGLGVGAQRVPADTDEASALLRSLLAGRRVLLVLDNARDAAQVRPLLPGSGECAVIVTSRRPLVTLDAQRIEIGGMPPDEAVRLLTQYAGDRAVWDPAAAHEVLRYCDHLPLAIRVTGARLLADPELSLAGLAARLADERSRLDLLEVDDLAVRASFGAGYQALDPAAAAAFGLLGLLRVYSFDTAVAAALWDVPVRAAEPTLDRLVSARLIERGGDRFRLHDLMRLFAMEHAAAQGDTAAALERTAVCYLGAARRGTQLLRPGQLLVGAEDLADPRYAELVVLPDVAAARSWFETERANLVAFAEQAVDAPDPLCRFALQLQSTMTMFLASAGHLADWQHLCELSARVADRLGDPASEAVAVMNLGAIAQRQGRAADAVLLLGRALELSRIAQRPSTQAAVLSYLASTYTDLGEPDRSAACHRRAIELRRAVGDHKSTAHALANAAYHFIAQRELDEAQGYLAEALEIKYAEQDLLSAGVTEVQLAGVLLAQGRHAEAVRSADTGLDLCRQYGDRYNEWVALLFRSVAHRWLGETRRSRDDAAACLAVCEALRQVPARNLAAGLLGRPPVTEDDTGDPVPVWLTIILERAGLPAAPAA